MIKSVIIRFFSTWSLRESTDVFRKVSHLNPKLEKAHDGRAHSDSCTKEDKRTPETLKTLEYLFVEENKDALGKTNTRVRFNVMCKESCPCINCANPEQKILLGLRFGSCWKYCKCFKI